MRVALVYLGRRGGGSAYSRLVATALDRRCDLLSFVSAQAENLADWKASGLSLVQVPTYSTAAELALSLLDVPRHLRLRRQVCSFSPDVIYYPMGHVWAPMINALLPGIPNVLTVHDAVLHLGERSLPARVLRRIGLWQCDRVIVLTRKSALALERGGFPRELVDVVPHGEFSFYASAARRISPPRSDGNTLLFFGRVSRYKGIDVLLEAFAEVARRRPGSRLLLVCSGDLGPFASALEATRGISVVNRWIADDEVHEFFGRADVVVLPYVDGSQSGVIPIAYAHALPVVATDVGGIAEQVDHGRTGLLVAPGDSDALARACLDLLDSPTLRVEMGRRGSEKASSEWSWGSVAERVLVSLAAAAAARRRTEEAAR